MIDTQTMVKHIIQKNLERWYKVDFAMTWSLTTMKEPGIWKLSATQHSNSINCLATRIPTFKYGF